MSGDKEINKEHLMLEFDETVHWLEMEIIALDTAITKLQGKREGVAYAIDMVRKEAKEFKRRNEL